MTLVDAANPFRLAEAVNHGSTVGSLEGLTSRWAEAGGPGRNHGISKLAPPLEPGCDNKRYLRSWPEVIMSVIAWIILGLVAGFIANKIVNHPGGGLIFDTVLGIIGAVVGGWLFSFFGAREVTGFNLYSLIVAIVGAVVVLLIYHAFTGARPASRF
jgi:uncharacterized membrane protein YeaQ/YmgE (transglycosylase-associated protein family)